MNYNNSFFNKNRLLFFKNLKTLLSNKNRKINLKELKINHITYLLV